MTNVNDQFGEAIVASGDVAGTSTGSEVQNPKPRRKRRSVSVQKPKPETTTQRDDVVPRACTECGKKFFSLKALFGHMRCHPERHWRGIKPPASPVRHRDPPPVTDEYEIATCLLLLAGGDDVVFECSSCKKVFRSHQALGGHRASHKNVKGCFAIAAQSSGPSSAHWASSPSAHGLSFDLNQPAPLDDHDSCFSSLSSSDFLDLRLAL